MLRRISPALCCLLALQLLSVAMPGTAAARARTRRSTAPLARLFALTQQYHTAAGCEPWTHDARLDRSAQLYAAELARYRRISHIGRDGSRVRDRARRQGYPANRASESIALYSTPEVAVAFWMDEPRSGPHRRNITWCQYTAAGVGVAYDSRGVAYWVMDYANRE